MSTLKSRRLIEDARYKSLTAAHKLKMLLMEHKLNIVTAESLTAGMICKTLIDVPGEGATVYGGFATYDTDAKREFIDVKTEGVYSYNTAKQMALGALKKSRAMVGLSVTGDAMPYPDAKHRLGVVYIGIAFRAKGKPIAFTTQLTVCDDNDIKGVCDSWKQLTNISPRSYAPYQFTSLIADYIRMRTVEKACKFAIKKISTTNIQFSEIPSRNWDSICKPSPILEYRTKGTFNAQWCDEESDNNIRLYKKTQTVVELRKKCKELGIKGYSNKSKSWLIKQCNMDNNSYFD